MITVIAADNIPIQTASIIVVILTMIVMTIQFYYDHKILLWILPMFIWMIHGLIFYSVLALDRFSTLNIQPLLGSYTIWSSILRFHGYLTILGIEATHLYITIYKRTHYGPH